MSITSKSKEKSYYNDYIFTEYIQAKKYADNKVYQARRDSDFILHIHTNLCLFVYLPFTI